MAWYIDIGVYLWNLFKLWVHTIFVTPIQNKEMLWLLVPIWIAWFFAEFFQEKTGTSLGNAMSNAVIIVWGSIDCFRQTVDLMQQNILNNGLDITARFTLGAVIFAYGVSILILGWKGNAVIKKLGRVRTVTYVFAMFVPIFYNAIPFSLDHFISTILFFPIFYFFIEVLDRIIPDPQAVVKDNKKEEFEFKF